MPRSGKRSHRSRGLRDASFDDSRVALDNDASEFSGSELTPDSGLYLNDILNYNQEDLVRRYAPHYDVVDDDYGHDDQFPDKLDEEDLWEYYEPLE